MRLKQLVTNYFTTNINSNILAPLYFLLNMLQAIVISC